MNNKTILKSIRISEDMADLIDRQAGSTFTEKWENLVTRCIYEIDHAEQRLEWYRTKIQEERDSLADLQAKKRKIEQLMTMIQSKLDYYLTTLEDE